MFVCLFVCVIADREYTDNNKPVIHSLESFFLEKTVFGLCGFYSLLSNSLQILIGKTTSLTTSICLTVWKQISKPRMMVLNHCRLTAIPECLCVFSWEMFFNNWEYGNRVRIGNEQPLFFEIIKSNRYTLHCKSP